jgi:hypothetical protein
MNRRHKTVLALSLAVAGLALLSGAKVSEALGIILVGASSAWLIGSQFVLAGARLVWRHRIWSSLIAALMVAGVYGWIRFEADQTAKQEAAYQAKMKPVLDCESRNAQFSNADTECEKDPSVALQPIPQPTPQPSYNYAPPVTSRLSTRHVKALNDTELTTTEIGSLTCGHIQAGKIAVLLVDDSIWVKIRTADGQVGWALSKDFEVVGR